MRVKQAASVTQLHHTALNNTTVSSVPTTHLIAIEAYVKLLVSPDVVFLFAATVVTDNSWTEGQNKKLSMLQPTKDIASKSRATKSPHPLQVRIKRKMPLLPQQKPGSISKKYFVYQVSQQTQTVLYR